MFYTLLLSMLTRPELFLQKSEIFIYNQFNPFDHFSFFSKLLNKVFKHWFHVFFVICNYFTQWIKLFLTYSDLITHLFRGVHWRLCAVCLCSRVMTYREHGAWVVKAHLQKETDGHVISVRSALCLFLFPCCIVAVLPVLTLLLPTSVNGDVRFFEPRTPDSVNVLQTVKGLTALDIHPQANLFAWWVCLCGWSFQFFFVK